MSAARAMFQAKTTRGQTSAGGAGKDLWTQHANAIVGMESMGQAGDPTCSKLSSCGERCALACAVLLLCLLFLLFRGRRGPAIGVAWRLGGRLSGRGVKRLPALFLCLCRGLVLK